MPAPEQVISTLADAGEIGQQVGRMCTQTLGLWMGVIPNVVSMLGGSGNQSERNSRSNNKNLGPNYSLININFSVEPTILGIGAPAAPVATVYPAEISNEEKPGGLFAFPQIITQGVIKAAREAINVTSSGIIEKF